MPCIGGKNAPPTMAILSNAEPFSVKSPILSMPKLKRVGNIMEIKTPNPTM